MRIINALLLLLMFVGVRAQEFSTTFANLGDAEKNLTTYAKDKDAEAVVLFDKGKSYFEHNDNAFDIIFERQTRIKILSESAMQWAEVEIPLYQENGIYEKAYDIVANTYNMENGHFIVTKLDVKTVYEETLNNSWVVKKFVMPNVKKGSIIEYQYKVSSQHIFNIQDWEFQWRIPVVYSSYEVRLIPFYEYTSLLQGNTTMDEKQAYTDNSVPKRSFHQIDFHDRVYVYVKKDVPAFYDESFITSVDDYITKIDFQLAKVHYPDGRVKEIKTTWEKMVEDLCKSEYFGYYIKKSSKLSSKLIDQEKLAEKNEMERFNEVVDYVKASYNWNDYNSKYSSKTAKEFVKEKIGNCADINLFTIGILQSVGLDAYPVLSSTRNNGKVKHDYPFSHFFNYVLIGATIDGKRVLSDATEVMSSNFRIPARCINDKGLVVKDDTQIMWVGLSSKISSELAKNFIVKFDEDLDMHNSCIIMATEYNALYYRNEYADDKEAISEKIIERGYECEDSSIQVRNCRETDKPYILGFNFEQESERINNKIYISPFFNESVDEVPFKQKERTYPIDMTYNKTKKFNTRIYIPEGYKVDFVPEKRTISNDIFELHYTASVNSDNVNITFTYEFLKAVYSPSEYAKIKYYFKEIVKKSNEKVVLVKDSELVAEK